MRFNEDVAEGIKSDDSKHGDKIDRNNLGVETRSVEEIAEETPLFMEYVEVPDSRTSSKPDFGGEPLPRQPPQPEPPDPPTQPPPDVDNPFEDLGDEIDYGNIDFSDTVGLLQAQLQLMNIMSDLMVRMASQQDAILSIERDIQQVTRSNFEANRRILQNVSPFQVVSVSGVNELEDPGNPEIVVPNSDETDIPTRELMIKSSRNNNQRIWFGDDKTSPNSGFSLSPGEATTIQVDLREQQLYMSSSEADQVVELLGVV